MNSEQALAVANRFQRLSERFDRIDVHMWRSNVDMWWVEGSTSHACGCHASLYAFEKYIEEKGITHPLDIEREDLEPNTEYPLGAHLMAKDLGFRTKSELEDWAHEHPELWGNAAGEFMFSSERAITNSEFFSPSVAYPRISDIVQKWTDVAERLKDTHDEEE